MLGASLKRLWESLGPVECTMRLAEGLESGRLKPKDFSLRETAEAFCGPEWVRRLNPQYLSRLRRANPGFDLQEAHQSLLEAGDAVDVSAFSNITGQILYTKIMDGWKEVTADAEKLCDNQPTQFDGEKIPWLGHVEDEGLIVRPGEPYPETKFSERYIETPATDKRGLVCSITKEMIFFDRTAQALKRAGEVGQRLGYNKAKRVYDAVLGITNSYSLNGTSYNTYLTSGGWINSQASTELVDYTSLEQAYILASNITDPDTGNPLEFDFKQLVVQPAKVFTAKRMLNATEYRTTYPVQGVTSGNAPGNVEMLAGNPVNDWNLDLVCNPLIYQRITNSGVSATNANDWWFIGDFKAAFVYMENWPITITQAPANNIKEFEQDVVHRTKASERGVISVHEPRKVIKFINGS